MIKCQVPCGGIIELMNETMITEQDIRGTNDTGLTTEYSWNVGKAVADWLPTAGNVVVLYVPAGLSTAQAIIEGLRLQGRSVVDGGVGDRDAAVAAGELDAGNVAHADVAQPVGRQRRQIDTLRRGIRQGEDERAHAMISRRRK